MTGILAGLLVGLGIGGAAGTYLSERARATAAEALGWAEKRIDAWRHADTRTDLDVVGPATGQQQAVEP